LKAGPVDPRTASAGAARPPMPQLRIRVLGTGLVRGRARAGVPSLSRPA
jgi:hypothetical protein